MLLITFHEWLGPGRRLLSNNKEYLKKYYTLEDSIREQMYNKRIADIQLDTHMETHESTTNEADNMTRLVTLENELEQASNSRNIIMIILILVILIAVPVIFNRNLRLHKLKTELIQAGKKSKGINSESDQWVENLQKKAKEADTAKNKLFQLLNVELKQPVNELKRLLAENPVSKVTGKNTSDPAMNNLYPLIFRVSDKLNNFLNWSGIQTGSVRLQTKMIFLKSLLDETIQSYGLPTATKKITVINKVKGETTCHSDPEALGIVFQNTLSGAIESAPDNGFIKITADESNEKLQLHFTQECHINDESKPDILQAVHSEKSENDSDLSMIVSKAYLQKLKSTLEIVNSNNGNRTFRITLPKFTA